MRQWLTCYVQPEQEQVEKLKALHVDAAEYSCLKAIVLFTTGNVKWILYSLRLKYAKNTENQGFCWMAAIDGYQWQIILIQLTLFCAKFDSKCLTAS